MNIREARPCAQFHTHSRIMCGSPNETCDNHVQSHHIQNEMLNNSVRLPMSLPCLIESHSPHLWPSRFHHTGKHTCILSDVLIPFIKRKDKERGGGEGGGLESDEWRKCGRGTRKDQRKVRKLRKKELPSCLRETSCLHIRLSDWFKQVSVQKNMNPPITQRDTTPTAVLPWIQC